jgi:ATP/maltotriose-dependent transcriptional regulator MalT/DNA-binding SARP family transcriptional activator
MLTAGPGTGKTFLIHQLLRHGKGKTAYIDLKKLSSDITIFVRQLERLFTELWPDIFRGLQLEKGRQRTDQFSPRDRIDFLLDELFISGDRSAVIALDGCEVLAERPSWAELIALILQRFPSFVSIILASNFPLKFPPLPSLRLQGKLLELTTKDLHFDRDEIYQFLSKNIPGLKKEYAGQIRQKVGGWPAGLSLLGLEFRKKDKIVSLDSISPENLYDYLQGEVLAALSPEDLQILCTAALLQPFDYELLEKFLPVSRKRLVDLFSSLSFFLDRVDNDNESEVKQIAHLYATFFSSRAASILGNQAKKKLHRKAARYFQKSGLTDRALTHLIALEDWTSAVKLILADHRRWLTGENYEQLPFWVDQLPQSRLAQHPRLAILLGQAHLYLGNLDQAVTVLSLAHDHARKNSRDWLESGCRLCEVLLLKGCLREGVELAGELVDCSRLLSRYRTEAMMFQAIGLNLLCRLDECKRLWRHISTIANSKFLPLDKTARCYLMAPKAIFYNLERGEFEESEQILDHAISVFRDSDPRKRLGWILLFKGVLKLELHQYSEALTWFREAVVVSGKTNRSVHAGCTAFLSFVLAALGHMEEARLWYERAEPLIEKDLTLWAPVLCALVRVHLSEQPEETVRDLKLAWNLSSQRNMLLPMALTAYTAFTVHAGIPQRDPAVRICSQAADTCRQRNVYHREAQVLLYLHLLQAQSGNKQQLEQFTRAMTLISEKELGFLLTDDKRIDGLALAIEAIKLGIATDFFLDLSRAWGRKAFEALMPLFQKSTLDLKLKIAAIWARNSFRPALPYIERAIHTVKRKKTVTKLNHMVQQLKESPPDPLHIHLFGPFTLIRGEETIPDQAWKRLKARELFKMLCLCPDTTFTLEQLTEIFWPESSPDKARANLWSAVSAFRSAIEPELSARAKSSYLQGGSQTYKLQLPTGSTIDTILFEEKAKKGFHYRENGDNARALLYFELAVNLYRDELLPEDLYAPWTAEPREQLGLLLTRVLRSMAAIYFDRRDLNQCIQVYWKIITLDLWDEDSYFALMQCYVLQGRDLKAIKVFRRCEEVLQEELDVAPNRQLQDLLQRIIKRRSTTLDGPE